MTSIACTLDIDEAEATAWPDGNHTKASSKANTESTSLTTTRVYEPRGQALDSSFHDRVHCSQNLLPPPESADYEENGGLCGEWQTKASNGRRMLHSPQTIVPGLRQQLQALSMLRSPYRSRTTGDDSSSLHRCVAPLPIELTG